MTNLLENCRLESNDGRFTHNQLNQLLSEIQIEQSSFKDALDTLRTLDNTDQNIIETLFYYKLTDKEEYEKESVRLAKEYKYNSESVKTNEIHYKVKKKKVPKKNRDDF